MARHVQVVYGKIKDGDTETSSSNTLSKKIYDLIGDASVVHDVSFAKFGKVGVALVIWDD